MSKDDNPMYMKCAKTGKYIKFNAEEVRKDNTQPLWVLVDTTEEATNDPGWIFGEDQNMLMLQYMNEHHGCSSFTCVGKE